MMGGVIQHSWTTFPQHTEEGLTTHQYTSCVVSLTLDGCQVAMFRWHGAQLSVSLRELQESLQLRLEGVGVLGEGLLPHAATTQ